MGSQWDKLNKAFIEFIPSSSYAPGAAKYWTSQAEAGLTAEINLGALTTGLLKHTVSAGISTPATAIDGTDYLSPIYISDTIYGAGWNGDTTHAPSKNAVYDKIELVQADLDGFPDELKNLTTAEIQQLENIGTESISATEWGYLAALNQSLTTSSNVQFNQVTSSLVGNASTATTLQTARTINGVSFNGSANITINAVTADTEVTAATVTLAGDTEYRMNRATLITATLPTSISAGQTIVIIGYGAGGWTIAQNASQIIHVGNVDTTTGTSGSLSSSNRYDSLILKCVVANLEFVAYGLQGNPTVV